MRKQTLFSGLVPVLAVVTFEMVSALPAVADDFYLGKPKYGGTGCPAGSVGAAVSPDKRTISVIFDKYALEAGKPTGRTLDRKHCDIAIPVHIPQGFSVSLYKVDFRGFNSIPAGGSSTFKTEYFFAGSRGRTYTRNFNGPIQDNFGFTDVVEGAAVVWTACGADTNLRANTNFLLQTNRKQEQALASLDTVDVTGGVVYQLQWKKCIRAASGEVEYLDIESPEDEV